LDHSYAEAEAILKKGLDHVAVMRRSDPNSAQAREVGAFLTFCQGQCAGCSGNADDSINFFQRAIDEMQVLCTEFPWNRSYWQLVRYFQRETTRNLQTMQQQAAAVRSIESMAAWLKNIVARLPDDRVPQTEFERCRKTVIKLLRSIGQEREATAFEAGVSSVPQ
jgi:hypothetical protein